MEAEATIGKTALHVAAEREELKIIEFLLSHGANINAIDNDGVSVLCRSFSMEQTRFSDCTNKMGRSGSWRCL